MKTINFFLLFLLFSLFNLLKINRRIFTSFPTHSFPFGIWFVHSVGKFGLGEENDIQSYKYYHYSVSGLGFWESMEGRSDVDAAADRISKLPEPILQHILYFLLAKDAARMSTLSKVWDSAWNSLSSNFGDKFLKSKDMPKLVNVVNQTLANRQKHKISMQKFSLGLPHHRWLSYVDDWIKILIACNIKELNLRVSRPIYEGKLEYNSLPEAIFAAKALNVLRLDGFKIELPSNGIKFSSLRELRLSDVFLNEEFIQALCTSCCNLEDLYLQNFDGLASFQVG